ncbi:MAG: hypothetical protein ACRDAQ_12490, partial [Cetobacterium sp.]
MSLDLPSDAARALPVSIPFLSPSGEDSLSNAVSIDLPSDAARALPVTIHLFFFLSSEAYSSDTVSIDLLSDAARALLDEHPYFTFH